MLCRQVSRLRTPLPRQALLCWLRWCLPALTQHHRLLSTLCTPFAGLLRKPLLILSGPASCRFPITQTSRESSMKAVFWLDIGTQRAIMCTTTAFCKAQHPVLESVAMQCPMYCPCMLLIRLLS